MKLDSTLIKSVHAEVQKDCTKMTPMIPIDFKMQEIKQGNMRVPKGCLQKYKKMELKVKSKRSTDTDSHLFPKTGDCIIRRFHICAFAQ